MSHLDHTLRRVQQRRDGEPRRALDPDTGEPIPLPAEPPHRLGIFDKARLLYRAIRLIKNMKRKSWKTTLGGILLAIAPLIPQLLPEPWHWLQAAAASMGGLILGTAARDNDVTSEDAGAK